MLNTINGEITITTHEYYDAKKITGPKIQLTPYPYKYWTEKEIYEQITELFTEFSLEHSKTSKAAHGRARSAATKIKKLIAEYKRTSVAEDKA